MAHVKEAAICYIEPGKDIGRQQWQINQTPLSCPKKQSLFKEDFVIINFVILLKL